MWQDSATESGPYCKFAKIRGLITSMTDDSMIRCIEPGILEAGSSDGDFHGFPLN